MVKYKKAEGRYGMELMQLRYFVTVAHFQSITKAAQALYITQPALSRSIARLEKELDLRLFQRTANRVVLTEAGACYLQAVQQAFDALDAGLVQARQANRKNCSQIRVLSAIGLMKRVASEYEKEHPLTEIQVELANTRTITRKVVEGKADLGISLMPVHEERLYQEVLMQAGYYLVASPGQEFYERKTVSLTELQNKTLFCSRFGDTKAILEQCFAQSGLQNTLIELDEQALLFQASIKGLGYTVCIPMPALFHGSPAEGQVRFIPVEELRHCGKILLFARQKPELLPQWESFIRSVRYYFTQNQAALENL